MANFNNISVVSWRPYLLVEDIVEVKHRRPSAGYSQMLSYKAVVCTHCHIYEKLEEN